MKNIINFILILCFIINIFVNAMFQQEVKIISINGIHVRPASQIVKEAKKFESDINIISDNKSANAKSLFKLQTLELNYGKVIIVSAEGIDEKEAVESLVKLISSIKE